MFLLVLAHPGCPRQSPESGKTVVCMCVCAVHLGFSKICQISRKIHGENLHNSWKFHGPVQLFSVDTL